MKNLIRIGGAALFLIIVSLMWIWRPTSKDNDTTQPPTKVTEENDMNAQTTSLPETKLQADIDQEYIDELKNEIRKAKAEDDEGYVAELEQYLQEALNPPELPDADDDHAWIEYYNNEIRELKKSGSDERYIAQLERMRDIHIQLAAEEEAYLKRVQEEKAAYEKMTDAERVAHWEKRLEKLQADLLVAKTPSKIENIEFQIELEQSLLESAKDAPARRERDRQHREIIARMYRTLDEIEKRFEDFVEGRFTKDLDTSDEVLPDSPAEVLPSQSPPKRIDKVHRQFQSWQEDVNKSYIDVILSQYMTPKELGTYFPTESDRQYLKMRTESLQKAVVSKIRKVVSDLPNASAEQKHAFARELIYKNFEKSFAESVLKALEKEPDKDE